MAILILLLTLVALGSALQQATTTSSASSASTSPTVNHSANFRLVANVTSSGGDFTTSIENWVVSSHSGHKCTNFAILVSSTIDSGRTFYINGTAAQVVDKTSNILTDGGGSDPTPYGLVVSNTTDLDSEGRRGLHIDCGEGTPGLSTRFPAARLPHLTYAKGVSGETFGAWYACNSTVPKAEAVVLYFRNASVETPVGCADVKLYPECLGSGTNAGSDPQPGPCYESVASFD